MSFNEGPVDSKRKKKMLKKSSKGEIHNFESYRECVLLGIDSKPEFYMVPDKTRQHAKHDLNISEVRELLIAFFSDEPNLVPKYFSVKNKGFIRNVLVLHISDCEDPVGTLSAFSTRSPTTVRISRQDGELSSFPEKLFSISNNEASFMIEEKERKDLKSFSSNSSNKNNNGDALIQKNVAPNPLPAGHKCSMTDCVLSQSTQIMWGYPIRLANTTSSTTSINTVAAMSSSGDDVGTASSNSLSLPLSSSISDTSSFSLLDKRNRGVSTSDECSDPKKARTEDSVEHSPEFDTNVRETSNDSVDSVAEVQKEKEVEKEGETVVVQDDVMDVTMEEKFDTDEVERREETVSSSGEQECSALKSSDSGDVNGDSVGAIGDTEREHDNHSHSDATGESNSNINNANKNEVTIKNNTGDGLPPVGIRAGTVPTKNETCTIFSQSHTNATTDSTDCAVALTQENTISSTTSPSSSSPSSSSSLLFPSFSVSIRSTRESSPHGMGATGFRDTVCATSQDFDKLWMPSDVRTAPLSVAALDCEMCDTSKGLELTRLTVIDQTHRVVLDTLVKPSSPITNYRTQWSGITEEILTGVTVTLQQAQLAFMRIVSKETFLIGHSLDSDLKSLFMTHNKCIDTAILFPHPRGFPYRLKLKELAETHLNIIIQRNSNNFTPKIKNILCNGTSVNDGVKTKIEDKKEKLVEKGSSIEVIETEDKMTIDLGAEIEKKRKEMESNKAAAAAAAIKTHSGVGHDSIEDASTALRLVTLKLEKGMDFGSKTPHNGRVPLSRFLVGTGTTDSRYDCMDGSSVSDSDGISRNVDNTDEDKRENEDKNKDEDKNGSKNGLKMKLNSVDSSAYSVGTLDPSFAFFWTMKEECSAMAHCLPPSCPFIPHAPHSTIIPKVQQTISEGGVVPIGTEGETLGQRFRPLRNQLMCYVGVQKLESKLQVPSKIASKVHQKVDDGAVLDYSNCDDKEGNDDKNSDKNETSSTAHISSIVDTLKKSLESTGLGSILIITAQLPLSQVISLSRQKKACDSPQSVSIWTPAQEERLRDAYVRCNYASMVTISI